jgi:hypothetical protein
VISFTLLSYMSLQGHVATFDLSVIYSPFWFMRAARTQKAAIALALAAFILLTIR